MNAIKIFLSNYDHLFNQRPFLGNLEILNLQYFLNCCSIDLIIENKVISAIYTGVL